MGKTPEQMSFVYVCLYHMLVYMFGCVYVCVHTCVYTHVEACQRSMWHVSSITCYLIFYLCVYVGI